MLSSSLSKTITKSFKSINVKVTLKQRSSKLTKKLHRYCYSNTNNNTEYIPTSELLQSKINILENDNEKFITSLKNLQLKTDELEKSTKDLSTVYTTMSAKINSLVLWPSLVLKLGYYLAFCFCFCIFFGGEHLFKN